MALPPTTPATSLMRTIVICCLLFRGTHARPNGQPIPHCLRIREADYQHWPGPYGLVIGCAPSSFEYRDDARTAKRRVMLNSPPANTTGSHSRIEGVVTARPRPLSHEIICNTADGNVHCLHCGNHGSGDGRSRCGPCRVIAERGGT